MGLNKHKPGLYVIPEDDADRQIANGFLEDFRVQNAFQVMPPAQGREKVLSQIIEVYVPILQKYKQLKVIGVLDFDGRKDRYEQKLQEIPNGVRERVFLLGTLNNPEKLKASAGLHFESLGEKLAQECCDANFELWNNEQLVFLKDEVLRAKEELWTVLFG